MIRYTTTIGTRSYILAQGRDIEELQSRMVDAVHSGGAFVDFVVFGNRRISVLVSPGVAVIFEGAEVDVDSRDTGDTTEPFSTIDEWVF